MGPFDHTIDVSLYYPCGAHEMSPLQSIKTIGDENMEQRKFKVGDRVRIKSGWEKDKIGKIVNIGMTLAFPYLVLFDEKINRLDDLSNLRTDVVNAGYDPDKCFFYTGSELLEEKEMTGFELLLKHWGIEVGEKFNIKGSDFNPYYFDKDGDLYDRDDDIRNTIWRWDLITGRANIEKIKVKEMTIADIEKELGYAIKVVKEDK